MTQIKQALENHISTFIELYFLISCFSNWWKNILCGATKYLRFKKKEETKTPRQIRHVSYCEWALKIMKFHQEDTFTHYSYIRALVPNDTKDEILEDSYKMSLKEFCKAMQINLLKCFTGSCFWKIYCKTFAAFLVNFLVNFF